MLGRFLQLHAMHHDEEEMNDERRKVPAQTQPCQCIINNAGQIFPSLSAVTKSTARSHKRNT